MVTRVYDTQRISNMVRIYDLMVTSDQPTPAPVEQYSGGFFEIPQVKRPRSVKEERERLGIIPREVKQIVKAIARATVAAEKTDIQAQAQLLSRLEQQDIEAKAKYAEFMRQERDRLRTQAIARAVQIQRRKKQLEDEEDDRDAVMLLMS